MSMRRRGIRRRRGRREERDRDISETKVRMREEIKEERDRREHTILSELRTVLVVTSSIRGKRWSRATREGQERDERGTREG